MQCTGILLVHENNTWQNSTANEGFESVGRGCLDLARGSQILATLLSTGAFATDERGMARVLMLSCILQRARWRRARMSCVFLSHHTARACRRPTGDPQITPSNRSRTHYDSNSTNRTKFTQTRRQTDISYKQRRKSYKIPDFHTNMTDFITFK